MKSVSSRIIAASFLLGSAQLSMAAGVSVIGCYKSSTGVTFDSTSGYNSKGYCSGACPGSAAFATSDFSCYCGDEIPSDSDKVDDKNCNIPCPGFPADNCGGTKFFYFYNMGTTTSVPKADSSGSSSSPADSSKSTSNASQTTSAKPSVITVGGETVVVTATNDPSSATSTASPSGGSDGGPNKAGIAAGVVVGVVAAAAIAGGLFLFIRNRKRRAIEEEHRRNAAVSSFISGGKPPTSSGGESSFTDTRLDPAVMAQRRMSDGSIADNQDYSRRILKVTNA